MTNGCNWLVVGCKQSRWRVGLLRGLSGPPVIFMNQYRDKLNKLIAQREYHKRQAEDESAALSRAQAKVAAADKAQQVLQHVAREIQEQAHAQISAVVSMCLEAIFDDPYQFEIVFEKKRGKTEATLTLLRDGNRLDPMSATGGGVKDTISMALRLARIAMQSPQRRRVLFLDEPWSSLKPIELYGPRICELMERLTSELDFQIIQTTHIDSLRIGKIIEI